MEEEEEGAAEWMGRAQEREPETKLHSWDMRMVTMATAAKSHMMRRSERENWRCEREKATQSERVGRASRQQRRGQEKDDNEDCRKGEFM